MLVSVHSIIKMTTVDLFYPWMGCKYITGLSSSIAFTSTHLQYTPGWIDALWSWVKCLAQDKNTITLARVQTTLSRVECTNHEATRLLHKDYRQCNLLLILLVYLDVPPNSLNYNHYKCEWKSYQLGELNRIGSIGKLFFCSWCNSLCTWQGSKTYFVQLSHFWLRKCWCFHHRWISGNK